MKLRDVLIYREMDEIVFKGNIAGKTATILIRQALLSGHEAFRTGGYELAVNKADNRKLCLRFKGL